VASYPYGIDTRRKHKKKGIRKCPIKTQDALLRLSLATTSPAFFPLFLPPATMKSAENGVRQRLPTLDEVLTRKSRPPVDLFCFYVSGFPPFPLSSPRHQCRVGSTLSVRVHLTWNLNMMYYTDLCACAGEGVVDLLAEGGQRGLVGFLAGRASA
jgi:hypothetical protein